MQKLLKKIVVVLGLKKILLNFENASQNAVKRVHNLV